MPRAHQALAAHDRAQELDRIFKLIVDEDVVVPLVIFDFTRRGIQTALDHFFTIFAALAQPVFERFAIGRKNEDAGCVRKFLLNLRRALHIDVEQKIAAILFRFI